MQLFKRIQVYVELSSRVAAWCVLEFFEFQKWVCFRSDLFTFWNICVGGLINIFFKAVYNWRYNFDTEEILVKSQRSHSSPSARTFARFHAERVYFYLFCCSSSAEKNVVWTVVLENCSTPKMCVCKLHKYRYIKSLLTFDRNLMPHSTCNCICHVFIVALYFPARHIFKISPLHLFQTTAGMNWCISCNFQPQSYILRLTVDVFESNHSYNISIEPRWVLAGLCSQL